jgi:DME family drug/metabolite transporter
VPSSARAILAVIGAAALFGTAGTARELGPDGTTALGVGVTRIVVGTAVLWLAVWFGCRNGSIRAVGAPVRSNRWLILLGGLGVAIYTPMFFEAVERTGVAVGTIVGVGSGPFFAGALEWAWRGVRPSRWWMLGTVVTVSGGAVLVLAQNASGSTTDPVDAVGVAFALGAGFGYALYSVTSKMVMERGVHSVVTLASSFLVGAIGVALLAVREPFAWLTSTSGLLLALQLGVFATGIAYLLFGYGLHRLTSATTVTLVLAEPLTATMLAVLVLDESIVPVAWLGIVALLVGLLIVGRTAQVTVETVADVAGAPGVPDQSGV